MQGEEAEGGQGFAGLHPWQIHKPVLAAINGHAIGVGITYAMSCDIRFVAEDAKVQFAFVRRGVIPELSSHVIVARVAGLSNAADLLMTGRMITGREIPLFHWTANQSDAREGVEAFLEKREPEWKLRVSRDLPVLLSSSNHLFT